MTIPSDACGFRQANECGCTDTCPHDLPDMALVYRPTVLDQLAFPILIGAIAGIIWFVSVPRAVDAYHQQQLIAQEQTHVPSR